MEVPKNMMEVPKGYHGSTLAVLGATVEVPGGHFRIILKVPCRYLWAYSGCTLQVHGRCLEGALEAPRRYFGCT